MGPRARLAFVWALLIEALIVWPHPPEVPQPLDFSGIDKVVHSILFGTLAVLLARVLAEKARPLWIAVAVSAAYGAFTEFEQHFIPSRSMELGDFLADAAGATVGVLAFIVWARRRREFIS
jgi:VanZ family protein